MSKNWPTTKPEHGYMKMRQTQHRGRGLTPAELWFRENYLKKTNWKWTGQANWGYRLFDFWNHILGIAIEIDGPEHDQERDKLRDEKEWERSRIITYRIRNFDIKGAEQFLSKLPYSECWNCRRLADGYSPLTN